MLVDNMSKPDKKSSATPPVESPPIVTDSAPVGSTPEAPSKPTIEELLAKKKSLLDAVAEVDAAIDARKREFAQACSRVRILESKFYASGKCGGFIPPKGDTYDRERHPAQFDAIVTQGRAGTHFEFIGDE